MLQAPPITFGTARIAAQPSASSGPERLLLALLRSARMTCWGLLAAAIPTLSGHPERTESDPNRPFHRTTSDAKPIRG